MATNVNETSLRIAKGLVNVRNVNVFANGIECHASKDNLLDHWEQRSIILTSSRSNHDCFVCNVGLIKKITLLCSLVLDLRALDV